MSEPLLERVRTRAPAIAEDLEQAHALAQAFAAAGQTDRAEELAGLVESLLVSVADEGSLTTPEPSADGRSVAVAPVAVAGEPGTIGEPLTPLASVSATAVAANGPGFVEAGDPNVGSTPPAPRKKKPVPRAKNDSGVPPNATGSATFSKTPEDPAARVRYRLSVLASELAQARDRSEPTDRVAFEGIQTTMIEADRALGEGLVNRAEELTDQAERLLSSQAGVPSETLSASASGFLSDAQELLSGRAVIRGGVVAVRLDDTLHYKGTGWGTPQAGLLDQVRPLVRGYRSLSMTLVTVGAPSQDAFVSQRDALTTYLANRFQVNRSRMSWHAESAVPLEPGTYLILRENSAGS